MTYMDFMNADGLLTGVREIGNKRKSRNNDARKTIMAHVFVDMLMASSYDKRQEDEGREATEEPEQRQRKRSFLQKFVAAIFNDEETNFDHSTPQKTEETEDGLQQEDTRRNMVSELQHLPRDRKISFVVRVINGLISRSDHGHSQREWFADNIEDRVTHDSARDENGGGATLWRHEELEDVGNEDTKVEETYKNVHAIQNEDGIEELGIDKDDRFDVLVTAQHRERVDVHFTNDVKPAGLHTDLGCEYERGEKGENDCSSGSSGVRKLRKSVAFSLPETPTTQTTRKKRDRELKLDDESVEKQVIISSPIYPPKKRRRPKTVKDWLKDPNVYKVALIFTYTRLVQDAVFAYLPLFLIERLQFEKWSYLLSASLVIGGAVWIYFQTPSTRQMTYAPVIIIGSGMSIMYVMALAFITELIGENKETSGSVISIITVIARLSSGGLVIGIQGFYPEKDIDSNEAISNYVHHVFAMVPGILTLVGFLLVLFFQPSMLACKIKAPKDNTEAQADEDEPPIDVHLPFSSKCTETPCADLDVNLSTNMVLVHSFTEDTKL